MNEKVGARLDLPSVAQHYLDRWSVASGMAESSISQLAEVSVRLDTDYCLRVGEYYHRMSRLSYVPSLSSLYDRLKDENLRQYQALMDAGITVEPWQGTGQPYRDSRDLRHRFGETGSLAVFLTLDGHGPSVHGGFHPLRAPSGIVVDGVELTHNDVFRVVHDLFGHVMFGHSFGPRGEFKAAHCHLHMYSAEVHPVLFTEHVGQICWFFFGPHLRGRDGRLPGPGHPDYQPPAERQYPEQKVFPFRRAYIDEFKSMFSYREPR